MALIVYKAYFEVTNRSGYTRDVIFGFKIGGSTCYAFRFPNTPDGGAWALTFYDSQNVSPGTILCEAIAFDSYDPQLLNNKTGDLTDSSGNVVGSYYAWLVESWLISPLSSKTANWIVALPAVTIDKFTMTTA